MPARPAWVGAVLALAVACGAADAQDAASLEATLDLRAVHSNSPTSWLNGGYGVLRFDADHEGAQLGRAQLIGRLPLTDTLTLNAAGSSFGDHDRNPVDLDEAWLELRPYPGGPLRWRVKLGAFYAPISFEHRAAGWIPVYTLTPSALNSWIGEELRTIGAEVEARWLGADSGYQGDFALIGALYGWNDPAGAVIADRGFAMSDRTSTLFGGLGRPRIELFHEIDGRPGYYGGLDWRHHEWLEVRALRYDNRADPGVSTISGGYAWRTWFTSLGARVEPSAEWTLLAQHLQGADFIGPDAAPPEQFQQVFRADFLLASYGAGRERLSLRYDRFATRQLSGLPDAGPKDQRAHAWTLAFMHQWNAHWSAALEALRVWSSFPPRAIELGQPAAEIDTQLQLALRYRWAGRY